MSNETCSHYRMVANGLLPVAIMIGISEPSGNTIACAGDPYVFPPPHCLCVYGALSLQILLVQKHSKNFDSCTDRFKERYASVHPK